MGAPVQFDPWAVLQELRQTPAATAATAANRERKWVGSPAATAAIAANQPNAASATVAAGGGVKLSDAPSEWLGALIRLEGRARPESIPPDRWAQAVADGGYLVHAWGAALARCGWGLADVFSCHRERPLARYDAMGLCLLLQGRKIGPLDQDRIAIRQPAGNSLHFRRLSSMRESVMLWELE